MTAQLTENYNDDDDDDDDDDDGDDDNDKIPFVLDTRRVAGANGVAAGSSLARPRHRWCKGPIQIGCENFQRWQHYLKLVKTLKFQLHILWRELHDKALTS